eukprot:gene9056-biopygen3688
MRDVRRALRGEPMRTQWAMRDVRRALVGAWWAMRDVRGAPMRARRAIRVVRRAQMRAHWAMRDVRGALCARSGRCGMFVRRQCVHGGQCGMFAGRPLRSPGGFSQRWRGSSAGNSPPPTPITAGGLRCM